MSLKAAIQKATSGAFNAISSLCTAATYTVVSNPGYNASTGVITPSEVNHTVSVLLADYAQEMIDGEHIKPGDQKAYIPAENFTPTCKGGDKLTISSEAWQVVKAKIDPAEAMWVLQIRKP